MDVIKLPDFDDMVDLAEEIGALNKSLIQLKDERDVLLADITMKVTTDPEFLKGGKVPAYNFIEATYHKTGYDDETRHRLTRLFVEIATVTGQLERAKNLFQVMRDMVSVWRAQQYNLKEAEF
jgi:hypothetical protein